MTTITKSSTDKMTATKSGKTDLPPYGASNPDPITGEAGAHPIEVGAGTALGGAAAGFVAGMAAGPIGAVIGVVAGGIAGGLGGKAVGEAIDPTVIDGWANEYFDTSKVHVPEKRDMLRPAYTFGVHAAYRNPTKSFGEIEKQLSGEWVSNGPSTDRTWTEVRESVKAGYDRVQLERR